MSPSSTACAAATWAAQSRKPKAGGSAALPAERQGPVTHAAIASAGKANTRVKSAPKRAFASSCPLTIFLIFIILYSMFRSFKWALLILVNVMLARVGGLLALLITHTNFSVSSGVGFLALFGVSVQTGVIMLEYINQLRVRGHTIADSAVEGAVLRLRPIMMTMLVATLGLLPAAMSHGIGSDSQRPFAIVIVGGLISDLAHEHFPAAHAVCVDGWSERRSAAGGSGVRRARVALALVPLGGNLCDCIVRTSGVEPEDLNGVGAANLHLQAAADGHELQMFRPGAERGDDAQGDLGYVRAIPGGFDGGNGAGDNGGMPAVELRAFEKTLLVAHVRFYCLAMAQEALVSGGDSEHPDAVLPPDRVALVFIGSIGR